MKRPDPEFEKRVLSDVIKQMADPEITDRDQRGMRKVVLGIGSTLLFVAILLAINDLAHVFFICILSTAGGAAIGMGAFVEWSHRQWPVTRDYIDMERVRKRLEELGD